MGEPDYEPQEESPEELQQDSDLSALHCPKCGSLLPVCLRSGEGAVFCRKCKVFVDFLLQVREPTIKWRPLSRSPDERKKWRA